MTKRKKYKRRFQNKRICICCGKRFIGHHLAWYFNASHRRKAYRLGYAMPYGATVQPEGLGLRQLRKLCHKPEFIDKKYHYPYKPKLKPKLRPEYDPGYEPFYNHPEAPCQPIAVAIHQDDLWLGKNEDSQYCIHITDQAYGIETSDMETFAAMMYIALGESFDIRRFKIIASSLRRKARGNRLAFKSLLTGTSGL